MLWQELPLVTSYSLPIMLMPTTGSTYPVHIENPADKPFEGAVAQAGERRTSVRP